MLRIDRHDLRPGRRSLAHDELARTHERLLIGKGNALFRPDGRERRPQAEHADDRRHNGVRQRVLRRSDEAVHTGTDFNLLPCQRLTQALRGLLRAHHGELRPEAAALLGHALHILPSSQRSDAHGQLLNDLERLPPDGAGHFTANGMSRIRSSVSGATSIVLSNRSRMPPWPGIRLP